MWGKVGSTIVNSLTPTPEEAPAAEDPLLKTVFRINDSSDVLGSIFVWYPQAGHFNNMSASFNPPFSEGVMRNFIRSMGQKSFISLVRNYIWVDLDVFVGINFMGNFNLLI